MASTPIQKDFQQWRDRWWPGMISRLGSYPLRISGVAQVPASGRKPRPGDAVFWDSTNGGFAVPTTDAESKTVVGIVSLEAGVRHLNSVIEYEDGDIMQILTQGHIVGVAGAEMGYGDRVVFDPDNATAADKYKWIKLEAVTTGDVADLESTATFTLTSGDTLRDEVLVVVNAAKNALQTSFNTKFGTFHYYNAWCSSLSVKKDELFEIGFGLGRIS